METKTKYPNDIKTGRKVKKGRFRRPVCAECRVEMIPIRNDISVCIYYDGEPDAIYTADLYRCPKCRHEILTDFSAEPYWSFEEGFEEKIDNFIGYKVEY